MKIVISLTVRPATQMERAPNASMEPCTPMDSVLQVCKCMMTSSNGNIFGVGIASISDLVVSPSYLYDRNLYTG